MIFLNAAEHFFHIRLGKVNQDRPAVWAVIRIVTLGQLKEQVTRRIVIQTVIGLDGAFAAHHNGQLCSIFLDGNFLGQEQHITHLIDACLNLLFLKPNGVLTEDKLIGSILF